jgi:hypothetical protein
MRPIILGSIGIRLQAEADAYFEDGIDPLSGEQRGAINSVLALHGLFVRLVPEWRSFVEEAEVFVIDETNLGEALAVVEPLALSLEKAPEAYDPEIASVLRFVAEIARKFGSVAKPVVLGFLRSVGNIVSALAHFLIKLAKKTEEKVTDQVSDAIAKNLARTAGATILGAATYLSPLGEGFPEMFRWISPFIKLVQQYFPHF